MTLRFHIERAHGSTSPHRMDVVCFVGRVARRASTPTPPAIASWLAREGWVSHPESHAAADADALREVPVPLDDWQTFDALFEWDRRPLLSTHPATGDSWLGAAVRAFFTHGGRRCYVVRVGDPGPADEPAAARSLALDAVVPGLGGGDAVEPGHRATWRGLGVLLGLDEVTTVVLPDLCPLVAQAAPEVEVDAPVPIAPPAWAECAETEPGAAPTTAAAAVAAPRCRDAEGLAAWRRAVNRAARFVADHRRDVTLVAALPQVAPETDFGVSFHRDPMAALVEHGAMGRSTTAGSRGASCSSRGRGSNGRGPIGCSSASARPRGCWRGCWPATR
ncbi:MAG: hypothetical protein R3F65_18065 [bacterium]